MKLNSLYIIFILLCIPLSACGSSPITITVLDAETKKPIEGAVAIAFWNQTKGVPGMTRTETVKIVEAVSNKNGKFSIPAVSVSIFADKPHLKVYKPGYVGWDSHFIYMGHKSYDVMEPQLNKRNDFKWNNQLIYLEKFNPKFSSFISHGKYIRKWLPTSKDFNNLNLYSIYQKETEWQLPFEANERNNLNNKKSEKR